MGRILPRLEGLKGAEVSAGFSKEVESCKYARW